MRRTIVLVLGLAIGLAACAPATAPVRPASQPAQQSAAATTPPAAVQETVPAEPSAPIALRVYYAYPEKLQPVARSVEHTGAVLKAALQALLAGPTAAERALGMSTQIPSGTRLRGVAVKANIAVVDLTSAFGTGGGTLSMTNRIAQVVYTCTQFKGIEAVTFLMDGKPVEALGGEGIIIDQPQTRADFEDSVPPILLETPALGAHVRSPLKLAGTSNVFEATHHVQVIDAAGKVVWSSVVHGSSGTGTRGTWTATASFTPTKTGSGKIRLYADSPKDGKPIDVVVVPIVIER